jgi:hypothetical protein
MPATIGDMPNVPLTHRSGSCRPQITLDGPAAAREMGCDLSYRPHLVSGCAGHRRLFPECRRH